MPSTHLAGLNAMPLYPSIHLQYISRCKGKNSRYQNPFLFSNIILIIIIIFEHSQQITKQKHPWTANNSSDSNHNTVAARWWWSLFLRLYIVLSFNHILVCFSCLASPLYTYTCSLMWLYLALLSPFYSSFPLIHTIPLT